MITPTLFGFILYVKSLKLLQLSFLSVPLFRLNSVALSCVFRLTMAGNSTTELSAPSSFGSVLRLTYPYTLPQNGRAELILWTLNDYVRTMLLHASMPPTF